MTKLPKQLKPKRTVNRWHRIACYLPEPLVNELAILKDSDFFVDDQEYWRCIRILSIINSKYTKNDLDFNSYVDLPRDYISKVVSRDGMKMWTRLKTKTNIIETHKSNYYKTSCYKFRFSSKYIQGTHVRVEYRATKRKTTPFEKQVINVMKESGLAMPISIDEFVANKIPSAILSVKKRIDYSGKIGERKYKPRKGNKHVIKGSIFNFIYGKVDRRLKAEKSKLEKIRDKIWRATRNKTNNRLDSNFTNLDSKLHQYIIIKNVATKSIDLSNSQFVLFANIIYSIKYNDTTLYSSFNIPLLNEFMAYCNMCSMSDILLADDVTMFCESAFNGTLYTDLANTLGIDISLDHNTRRKKAKTIAFELFFGSEEHGDSDNKKLIKEVYPNIVEIIDGFKKINTAADKLEYKKDVKLFRSLNKGRGYFQTGYTYFSVMLQQFESRIFIDEIYKPLLDDGQLILSMHDSFIFQEDYEFDTTVFDKYLPYGYDLK